MSKISSEIGKGAGQHIEIVTDLIDNNYTTRVNLITKNGNKIVTDNLKTEDLQTSNLTSALKKHDQIVSEFYNYNN